MGNFWEVVEVVYLSLGALGWGEVRYVPGTVGALNVSSGTYSTGLLVILSCAGSMLWDLYGLVVQTIRHL